MILSTSRFTSPISVIVIGFEIGNCIKIYFLKSKYFLAKKIQKNTTMVETIFPII